MVQAAFSCHCGKVRGTLETNHGKDGNHVRCFCQSCRAGQLYCGGDDPETSGVALFQSTPDRLTFERGQDLLAVFSFGPRNILRWQAACCKAPLFTTLRTPKFALAALMIDRLEEPHIIGPERSRAFVPDGKGTHHEGKFALFGGTLWRALKARISGKWKATPFFDLSTGHPVAPVKLVSREERKALSAPLS